MVALPAAVLLFAVAALAVAAVIFVSAVAAVVVAVAHAKSFVPVAPDVWAAVVAAAVLGLAAMAGSHSTGSHCSMAAHIHTQVAVLFLSNFVDFAALDCDEATGYIDLALHYLGLPKDCTAFVVAWTD